MRRLNIIPSVYPAKIVLAVVINYIALYLAEIFFSLDNQYLRRRRRLGRRSNRAAGSNPCLPAVAIRADATYTTAFQRRDRMYYHSPHDGFDRHIRARKIGLHPRPSHQSCLAEFETHIPHVGRISAVAHLFDLPRQPP